MHRLHPQQGCRPAPTCLFVHWINKGLQEKQWLIKSAGLARMLLLNLGEFYISSFIQSSMLFQLQIHLVVWAWPKLIMLGKVTVSVSMWACDELLLLFEEEGGSWLYPSIGVWTTREADVGHQLHPLWACV